MSQYLLSLPHDSEEEPTMESMQEMDPEELEEVMAAVGEFNTKLTEEGAWVFAGGLHPPSTATTVDNTGDSPVLTDGPFVEAKEYLGGFWVIEAPDRSAALDWAKLASKALQSRIEVRALQEAPAEDESAA
jgi:hypothetical protein